MENKKVYILSESKGEYEDTVEINIAAFYDKEKAEAEAKRLQDAEDELWEKYENFKGSQSDLLHDVFMYYMQNDYPEMYNDYMENVDLSEEETDFNFDEFDNIMYDFYTNDVDRITEWAKKKGCTEEEIEALEVFYEVTSRGVYGKSVYYVNSEPIEIIN